MNKPLSFILAAVALLAAVPEARSCTVPVFRYALENWPASPYGVYLFHRGPLQGEAAQAAALLRASSAESGAAREGGGANFIPVQLDLATTAGQAELKRIGLPEPATLPWMQAYAPERRAAGKEVWSGPPTLAAVRELLDSPRRREIARRLIGGDSAVWVLLETGDKARDGKAEAGLKADLDEGARQCQAAREAAASDAATSASALQLPIRFSVLRVARGGGEAALAAMLFSVEPGLKDSKDPVAFAIMGRGRVLPALAGKDLTRDNVLRACGFLTGDCSCLIKDGIPGVDLLLSADWEKAFPQGKTAIDEPRPALTGFGGFAEAEGAGR